MGSGYKTKAVRLIRSAPLFIYYMIDPLTLPPSAYTSSTPKARCHGN